MTKVLQPLSQLSSNSNGDQVEHKFNDSVVDEESCFTSLWKQNTIKIKGNHLAAYLIELETENAKLSAENELLLDRLRHWQMFQSMQQQINQ